MRRTTARLSPLLFVLLALLVAASIIVATSGCASDSPARDSDTTSTSELSGESDGANDGETADEGEVADGDADGDADDETTSGEGEPDDNAPASLTLTADDNGGTFAIKKGGTVTLTLAENPSTGSMWEMQLDDPEASLIEQIAEPSFEPNDPDAEDAGGMTSFNFKAVDAGEMLIRFVLVSLDSDEPDDTFEITLTVR